MHGALERAACTAGAASCTVNPTSFQLQHLPYSISEFLHGSDSQIKMISEQRSLPCLQLSTSKLPKRDHQRKDSPTAERPVSAASTLSSRRSVSNMKQLLLLKLQPTPPLPKVDLSSWLDDAIPNLPSPIAFDFENESMVESPESNRIPWMTSHDVRFPHDLPSSRYRELPMYSNPESPVLSQARSSDVGSSNNGSLKGSVCEKLCILSDYEDAETTNSYSQASFAECTETFDAGRTGTVEISPPSLTSSLTSRLSMKCEGEGVPQIETIQTEDMPRRSFEGKISEITPHQCENKVKNEGNPREAWLDSDSESESESDSNCSQSNSWSRCDELLDAFATKLTLAKASIVELGKASQINPEFDPRPKTRRYRRTPTPYGHSRRGMIFHSAPTTCDIEVAEEEIPSRTPIPYEPLQEGTPNHNPSVTSDNEVTEIEIPRKTDHLTKIPPWPIIPVESASSVHSPTLLPIRPTTFDGHKQFTRHQCSSINLDIIETSSNLLSLIYDVVQEFPQQMFFLDTPCVSEIRRQNYATQYAPRLSLPSVSSSDCALPLNQQRPPFYPRRTTSNFFGPLIRTTSSKSSISLVQTSPSYASQMSSESSTQLTCLSPPPNPPPPNMSAFHRIFPTTQDWWREVLYAHLAVYNYVCESQVFPPHPTPGVSSKASRTLGISGDSSTKPTPPADLDTRMSDLETELVSCITWVINCMSGRNNPSTDTEHIQDSDYRDQLLVRTLAEIVRSCEKGGGEKAKAP